MTNKEDKILKAFGKNLQKLRVERGFSTRKFAYEADISPSSLGRLEAGLSNPSLTTLLKLSEALKVDLITLTSVK
ncbi:MAG: helix-turn-helix transcriptional regulator [Bacteroidota bacterium]